MSQNEIAISVQGLKKSYKNIPVLLGVDFKVKTSSISTLCKFWLCNKNN